MSEHTIALGWNLPAPASKEELVEVLKDALLSVGRGDSFEGSITWSMPTDEPWLQDADFGLVARYRIGNLDGQGGLRAFTREVPEDQVAEINAQQLRMLSHGPAIPMAMALVQFIADLEDDERARRVITLQDIIDKAKECLPPE